MSEAPGTGAPAQSPQQLADTADISNIINQQLSLLAFQATYVRDLETQLTITVPPSTPPALPVGADLDTIMQTMTAAIRTQAGYIQNLEALTDLWPPAPLAAKAGNGAAS